MVRLLFDEFSQCLARPVESRAGASFAEIQLLRQFANALAVIVKEQKRQTLLLGKPMKGRTEVGKAIIAMRRRGGRLVEIGQGYGRPPAAQTDYIPALIARDGRYPISNLTAVPQGVETLQTLHKDLLCRVFRIRLMPEMGHTDGEDPPLMAPYQLTQRGLVTAASRRHQVFIRPCFQEERSFSVFQDVKNDRFISVCPKNSASPAWGTSPCRWDFDGGEQVENS
jgi:hypothetical protein